MKASNIIGMEVINLYEGQVDGYIKNLIFGDNYKKIRGFIVYSDKLDKEFYLNIKRIYKINDIVFTKNASVYEENGTQNTNSPINLPAYSSDGKNLGVIVDIEVDENFNVINFITANNDYIRNDIAKITNSLVIFNNETLCIKTSAFAPRNKTIKKEASSTNIVTNFNKSFLIGRKTTKDIFTFNNELLVKSGTIITERIVNIARLNGKLRELALNIQ